ncbi:MAG: hypothetical protein KAH04_06035, partial [Psychrilyobacter sp.]|nr:hypothetical protein [Psychrilyobacter sp.]
EAAKELLMVFATKILLLLHSLLRKAYSPLYKYTVFFSGIALLVAPFYTLFGRISQVLIILILVLNTTEDFLEKELNKVNIILLVMIFIAAFGIFFEIKEERGIFIMSYLANPIISGFRILVELVIN